MLVSSWLDKIVPSVIRSESSQKSTVPQGLWKRCPKCESVLYRPELEKNLDVCPKCQHHMRLTARKRIDIFLDANGRSEIAEELAPQDRLKFKDSKKYKDRLLANQKATGEKDALVCYRGEVLQIPVVVVAFEFKFLGGSMGAVVGEKFVRAVNVCIEENIPFIYFLMYNHLETRRVFILLM